LRISLTIFLVILLRPPARPNFVAPDALYIQDPGTTAAAKTNGRILRIPQ
jgi:hypothetical protein